MAVLDGKTALVTGASTGIGNATARAFATAGARVVLAARSEDRLGTLRAQIEADGGVASAIPTDVTDEDAVRELVARTQETYGSIDILMNSAGIADWGNPAILDSDLGQWRRELETNLLAVMSVTHHAAGAMRSGGHIINVSSGADRGFSGEYPAYVTSKWGVKGFTGSSLLGLREAGIRVTLVSPGEVATPMQPEEEVRAMRMLDPEDVAEAVIFAVTRPLHVVISELRIFPSRIE